MTDADKRREAVVAALDTATCSLHEIATNAGISEDSVYFYRMGIRNPSQQTATRLLRGLEQRQRRLDRALARLREVAK